MTATSAARADVRGLRSSPAVASLTGEMASWWRRNAAILGVLAASALAMVAWSVVVPAWESADESTHWQYANYIHDRSALPPYQLVPLAAYEPPLYYVLISPLAADGLQMQPAPSGQGGPRSYAAVAHDLADNAALHLARLATIVISLFTVLFVYLAAREATGRRMTGVAAALLVGLWPEFSFRGMTVSPDAMVAMAGAAATYLVVRGVRRGYSARLCLMIGFAIGVAVLTKLTGAAILAGATVAIVTEHGAAIRHRIGRLSPLLLAPAMVAPWLLYNQIRYGAPYAKLGSTLVVAGAVHLHSLFSTYFLFTFPGLLLLSSIGLFGWSNVPLPPELYAVYGLLIAGLTVGAYRMVRLERASRRLFAVLMSIIAAAVAGAIAVNLSFQQPVGRYLLPAIGAIGVLGALGLEHTPRWRDHERAATAGLAALMTVLQAIILVTVVWPAYATAG